MTLSEVEKLKLAREAAEARIAELESWYAASQESQRELLKRIALADRLAEAADRLNPTATDDEWRAMREALAAYREEE
jgi:hypothetical protein